MTAAGVAVLGLALLNLLTLGVELRVGNEPAAGTGSWPPGVPLPPPLPLLATEGVVFAGPGALLLLLLLRGVAPGVFTEICWGAFG